MGTDGKACLLKKDDCSIASHENNKCSFPAQPFLTLAKGPNRGHEDVVLPTATLELGFIEKCLNLKDADWVKEFAMMESVEPTAISKWDGSKELLKSVKKHTTFVTPSKKNASADLATQVDSLTDLANIISTLNIG